ncbi:MAG TPA: hypothetical protein VML36_06340 [Nitrospiria bacterium]|nr:hypothetical protein [Nitrospiria bacterium]
MSKPTRTPVLNRSTPAPPMGPEGAPDDGKSRDEDETYLYEAAGIRERHGDIPVWLALVSIGLLAWGVYYMIHYW